MLPTEGPTGSTLTHLQGSLSGARFPADGLIGLDPADSRPLLARYDLAAAARALTREQLARRQDGGLWRWNEILPVMDWRHVAHLGEGSTPLLPTAVLGRRLGVPRLLFKAEGLNPSGSFKSRGMAVAVSRAVELGARHLVAPSAGNAAGSLSAYAARAGARATLIMPADAPRANKVEVLVTGGELILMNGLISDCGRLARVIARETGAFDMSTLKEPYRLEGKKTMGLELAEQLGWRLPDVVVYPTGGGTGLVGMWKAFEELEALGLIGSERPRMVSVQTEGCAPIVRAFERGERFAEPWQAATTAAAGMRVPAAVGDFLMLDCIRASGGTAIAVPEAEIAPMQAAVGRAGGGFVSLETAAAVVAVPRLREMGIAGESDEVVLFDTAAGFKSDFPPLDLPAPISADEGSWDAAVSGLAAMTDRSTGC
ncbi:MAG: threonine synthase [Candidatus Dormibacteraeota bacterium]|nr:threonine synthase [Candidatus Dormibacteraeota bacterium]